MARWRQHYPPDAVQLTPNGWRVEFYDAKARTDKRPGQHRHYLVDGEQPDDSVTGALDVLDKPALKGWAERIGVKGAIALAREGALPLDEFAAIGAMKSRGLCWWQVRDQASDRGTLTHHDLVELVTKGTVPDLDAYPDEQRGFIQGGCGWFADNRPKVIAAEQMVASKRHRVAGRFDFRLQLDGRVGIVDLKTTDELKVDAKASEKAGRIVYRPPYIEHVLQLEAYELCAVESGWEPTEFRAVLRVDSHGNHDCWESWVTAEDYLAVLACSRAVKAARNPKALAA